jgi:hypothetical protein
LDYLSIEQAIRGTKLAFAANVPIAWWGPPGIGKSSAVAQIAADMVDHTDGSQYELFDLRLSDKEPSDIGGIPFPIDDPNPDNKMKKVLEFLVTDLLPFNTKKKAIVLLDEFDRADLSVQNVALQIILDRRVNGHSLSENARIVLAGNGATDVGTSPLSKAAANRICHIYIETASKAALKSWLSWAEVSEVSAILQGFASYRQEVFGGVASKTKGTGIEELAYATPRSFVYADKLLAVAAKMPFKTDDILPAMVAGCVGKAAAAEFLAYRDIFNKLPTIEQIVSNPQGVALPTNPSVLYAFKRSLATAAADDLKIAEAVAAYALRWEDEPAGDMFRLLRENKPEITKSQIYKDWETKRERPSVEAIPMATDDSVKLTAWCMKCRKNQEMVSPQSTTLKNQKQAAKGVCSVCGGAMIRMGEIPIATKFGLPLLGRAAAEMVVKAVGGRMDPAGDTNTHTNRMRVKSSNGVNEYIASQNSKTGAWECSCKGWTTRHDDCRHLTEIKDAVSRLGVAKPNAVQITMNDDWRLITFRGNPKAAAKVGQYEIHRSHGRYGVFQIRHGGPYKFEVWVR